MPYITEEAKEEIRMYRNANNPGELNYCFTEIIVQYVKDQKLSYRTINDVIGALEGSKLEFYRRVAVPYEVMKQSENGDVYNG